MKKPRRIGDAGYRILRLLIDEGKSSTLELLRQSRERGHPLSQAGLYATLDRLSKRGFVSHEFGSPDEEETRRGARRKYYKIEGIGRAAVSDYENEKAEESGGLLGSFLSALPIGGGFRNGGGVIRE
ncbi:MAG: helix-turn-helix transcriptional regulator [Planctomycetota bacterium]